MNKSALLLILSACLAVACSSSSKQSYNEESSEIQENIEQSDEAQEQVKREPELPNGRSELYQQMIDERSQLKGLIISVKYRSSPAGARYIRKQYYEREERAELIIAYETYKGKLYDLYNKSQTEEETKFYYEEINKLEESWDEYRTLLNQFDEATEEKAMTD